MKPELLKSLPKAKLVALFETAFYQWTSAASYNYAIPKTWRDIGIRRYGFFILPMDETLARCAVDLSNRAMMVYQVEITNYMVKDFNIALVREFFQGLANSLGCNLHLKLEYGDEPHHIVTSKILNVRSGPGLNNEVVVQAQYGELLKTLEKRGDWVRVERETGESGWVSERLVWGW